VLRRRQFIGGGLAGAVALSFGSGFWRDALAATATPGVGPYGPLGAPDANGVRLPEGFSSRVVARGGLPVEGTTYAWPAFPDGAATFPDRDGGYILVVNSEVPLDGQGGASAIRFASDGSVRDAYRILGGTSTNCAGGGTPWGTWLSCEEVDDGRVWECRPEGPASAAIARPALGVFKHEAVTVDPQGKRLYLTEDLEDGGFYRFTPESYPDLDSGLLEIAGVAADGKVQWLEVPDPSAASTPTRQQVPASTEFKRGEGIWFDSGTVYVATTADSRIHAYDTQAERIDILYDAAALADPPLTNVDNITVSRSGDLFVCEDDGGNDPFDIALITPERQVSRFLKLTGPQHGVGGSELASELAGVIFDPSGTRMYFSSQRGFGAGVTYEVTGPFRPSTAAAPNAPEPPDEQTPASSERREDAPGSSPAAPRGGSGGGSPGEGLGHAAGADEAAKLASTGYPAAAVAAAGAGVAAAGLAAHRVLRDREPTQEDPDEGASTAR
jgi:secreted PhoX family phosphatase